MRWPAGYEDNDRFMQGLDAGRQAELIDHPATAQHTNQPLCLECDAPLQYKDPYRRHASTDPARDYMICTRCGLTL